MFRIIAACLFVSASLLLAGCGGGGGGIAATGGGGMAAPPGPDVARPTAPPGADPQPPGPEPDPRPQPPFDLPDPLPPPAGVTPAEFREEYERQAGLDAVKATAAHDRGGTGRGVIVGMFDLGANLDHPDLTGQYRFVSGYAGYEDVHDTRSGHGSLVAGVIAARRDGSGMRGVAYEAGLASWKLEFGSSFDEAFWESYAAGLEWLADNEVFIVNHSWGSTRFPAVSAELVPEVFVSAAGDYAEAGGVQVWDTGTNDWDVESIPETWRGQPTWQAGAPHFYPELQDSWLAVASLGLDGALASYANPCGVAAEWCIAAPGGDETRDGGIRSTALNGMYESWLVAGAPHVSGALAVLKSLFPNLDYRQVRDRILATADKTGIYADEAIYGQGRLDLDAASQPVGGTLFPLGAHDAGEAAATDGARIALPPGALARYFGGRTMLVLDGYQRAPFRVPAAAFASPAGGYLSLDDPGLLPPEGRLSAGEGTALAVAGKGFRAARARPGGAYFLGAAQGAWATEGLARLAGVSAPHGRFRMAPDAVGVALGFSSGAGDVHAGIAAGRGTEDVFGDTGYGIAGWAPRTVLSASFAPAGTARSFGAALASGLDRPMGMAGAGAFALSGDSVELGYGEALLSGEGYRLDAAGRLARLSTGAGPLVRLGDAMLAAAELELSVRLAPKVTLNARLGVERPLASRAGSIRVASGVGEDGRLAYDDIAIDGSDLLRFDRIGAGVAYAPDPGARLGAGAMAVRDGFGEVAAIVGLRAELRF